MTTNFVKTLLGTTALIALTGCDILNITTKTPLQGTREEVIVSESVIKPDMSVAGAAIRMPAPTSVSKWEQPSGHPQNAMPPLSFTQTPKLVWKTSIGSGSSDKHKLIAAPVYANGFIYTMDADGKVSAVNAQDGKICWSFASTPEDAGSPALGGGVTYNQDTVYVATSFAEVIALEAQTGKEKWRTCLPAPTRIAPFYHNNRLIVTTITNETIALDALTGTKKWSHAAMQELTGILGGATPAVSGNTLIVPYSSGEVFALRQENGYPSWNDTLTAVFGVDSVASIPHVKARPVVAGNTALLVSHGGRFAAVDTNTGVRKWQKEISSINTPAVAGNTIFVVTTEQELVALNLQTGQIYWSEVLPKSSDRDLIAWTGPIALDDRLMLVGDNGEMLFVSPTDGKKISCLKESDTFSQTPMIVDGVMYILGESGTLYSFR
jgi:outer membrane protein assembly factor BamB